MKLAFIYAGQGSQRVGMGKDFYEAYETYRTVMDTCSKDVNWKQYSFEGPQEVLNQTQYTQGCMVAFAVGVTNLLYAHKIRPELVCGLSLGEYSALYAAGCFTQNQVISIAQFRGQKMQEAAQGHDAKMYAVLGTAREVVQKACASVNIPGKIVSVANYNCPGQIVISGDEEAVECAVTYLREAGVKKILPVKVSGPFHTSIMHPASVALHERFLHEQVGQMQIPVVFNTTGKELAKDKTVTQMLEEQVKSSVYFEDSIQYMIAQGVDTIIEIGPGKTLSKFVKKIDCNLTCYSIDTVADFVSVCEVLQGGRHD